MQNKSKKTKQINVRLTQQQFDLLTLKAKESGKTASAFLIESLDKPVIEKSKPTNTKDLSKLLGSINKIGNNLNQIAHTLNIANSSNKLDDINYEDILNQLIILEYGLNNLLTECK